MSQPDTRSGELLVQRRLITAADLQETLDAQRDELVESSLVSTFSIADNAVYLLKEASPTSKG